MEDKAKAAEDLINSMIARIALLDLRLEPVTEIRDIPTDGSGVKFDPINENSTAYYIGFFDKNDVLCVWADLQPGDNGENIYHWPKARVELG